jgi:c(7)-type cytochrome triheme protein
MKSFAILCFLGCLGIAVIVTDLLFSEKDSLASKNKFIPFSHELHGVNLGLDCVSCHTGSRFGAHAHMPSKQDCLDCHRLPLTESPVILRLDSALQVARAMPWATESRVPAHVIFHHGVHAKANVSCEICHGSIQEIDRGKKASVKMGECLACHRGEKGFSPAATDCARCHR